MAYEYPTFTPEELQNEIWKPVPNYEGFYEVSTLGRVRNVAVGKNRKPGHVLRPCLSKDRGYLEVVLNKFGKPRHKTIHQLVAAAFIGRQPEGMQVNHKDTVKTHNRPENLEYITGGDNTRHAAAHGLLGCKGERHGRARLRNEDVIEIRRRLARGDTVVAVAQAYRINRHQVSKIKRGLAWKHLQPSE